MESAEYWMQQALALAQQAKDLGEVPVGAVLVRSNEVIGKGFNRTISIADPTAHAEIMAIRDAASRANNYRLPDTELYVTIEPCSMCAGALVHARVAKLIYGAKESRAGAVDSSIQLLANPALNHRVAICGGVCAAEAAALMTDFFKAKRG